MPRPTLPGNQHDVEPRLQIGQMRTRREVQLGRVADPGALPRGDGFERIFKALPGFHLDEGQGVAAPGDDVDLADARPMAPRRMR
jgi:hypothetical protein